MDTLQNMLENTAQGQDFHLLLGDFLDEFYRVDAPTQQKMIVDRPAVADAESLSFAAATAHKLANDYGLAVPDWVFERRCYSPKPFFGCRARGNLRLLFMYQSPPEFKHRNLFVDENVLARV
jgi:hypothetical protein